MTKQEEKKAQSHILTKSELTKIRKVMPYGWRELLRQRYASISLRQITQCATQDTSNPCDNVIVWSYINEVLTNAGKFDLAKRVEVRVNFYLSLCSDTQILASL